MKATVQQVIVDTLTTVTVTGHDLDTQMWDSGRVNIKVFDEAGRLVRWRSMRLVETIDVEVG